MQLAAKLNGEQKRSISNDNTENDNNNFRFAPVSTNFVQKRNKAYEIGQSHGY